jgi:hypothetical protein
VIVKYSKKVSIVQAHLKECSKFAAFLKEHKDAPSWYAPLVLTGHDKLKKKEVPLKKQQASMKQFGVPMLSAEAKVEFQLQIAKFFFVAGIPFHRFEHTLFKHALASLHPVDYLPSQKSLGDALLDKVYDSTKVAVEKKLLHQSVCIVSDGWSNIKNEAIVNYMLVSPTYTICSNIAGAITDNTSAKKAWRILRQWK